MSETKNSNDLLEKIQNFSRINYFKNFFLYFVFWVIIISINANPLPGNEIKTYTKESPVYKCYRVSEGAVHIDGKLTEKCWQTAPIMEFRDLVDGSKPMITSYAKLVWDNKYIYVAYKILDPNVVAYYGERKRGGAPISAWHKELHTGEPELMFWDTFVKFFLDPDADGRNYIEIHINPVNNVGDLVLDLPYLWPSIGGLASRKALNLPMVKNNPDWYWNCEGLKSAVQVRGTLNFSDDTDQGWTVELAVPWEALKPLTKGAYCPNNGNNKWRAHLGHVYKPEFRYEKRRRSKHLYATWPVLGVCNCHLPERWGYLIFEKNMSGDEDVK
ncbi:MAG: carbohydrate-binding family 9-like protein [Victivallaceae bacterium]|nr:carbohydrate-binding family 9-like protein [Victivallaceae bacterium]